MKRSDEYQQMLQAKKCATIIYYDIVLFFDEMTPLAKLLLTSDDRDGYRDRHNPAYSRKVLIAENWIDVVASLCGVFHNDEWIKTAYAIYGDMANIQSLLGSEEKVDENREELCMLFRRLGHMEGSRYTWFRTAEKPAEDPRLSTQELLEGLDRLIQYPHSGKKQLR